MGDPARGLRGADTPPTPILAQTRSGDASSRFIWTVALPAQATIRLRQGGSLSGRVVRITSAALTLTAGSQSQTVAMANVATIAFSMPEDLWIMLPNGGRQRLRPLRGLSVPISSVPSAAMRFQPFGDSVTVDLSSVLNASQFAKLNNNPRVRHVLQEIKPSPEGSLTLRVRLFALE